MRTNLRNLIRLETGKTVFTPYYNEWNKDAYTRSAPFRESPWDLPASSTSGAPVLITGTHFIGLTQVCDASFSWKNRICEIEAPQDAHFLCEYSNINDAWRDYHRSLSLVAPRAPYALVPEYCTWVEQVSRRQANQPPGDHFSIELVDELLDRIDSYGWPRGRFTIDEGWSHRHGPYGYGTWKPRPQFDMARLAKRIEERGHTPGLWLAPSLICPESSVAQEYPQALGPQVSMEGETPWNRFHFLKPSPESGRIIRNVFQAAYDWGFRKIKMDISYGPRREMLEIAKQCWEAAESLPGPVELEGHVPDPFFAQYCHVIRLNDVLMSAEHRNFKNVAQAHFEVCSASAPEHTLCLDHIGGNDPKVSDTEILEHIAILHRQNEQGYPVVGLFPHRFEPEVLAAMTNLLTRGQSDTNP